MQTQMFDIGSAAHLRGNAVHIAVQAVTVFLKNAQEAGYIRINNPITESQMANREICS
jgi:hypothetical protein